jgi:tRNA(Ile)-lysidine synthase
MDFIKLRSIVQEECQLTPDAPVVVGVSGGPDSLSLLNALQRLEYKVIVAHFDHCLRPESAQDAENVRQMTEKAGLPFVTSRKDVNSYAHSERLSIEEAARKARYHFLFDQAHRASAQAVAVAHTADDQVETVLMHLLRGAGLSGLKGMSYRTIVPEWDKQIPLVRPLLGIWRSEILAYCQDLGLQPLFDESNQDVTFFRNRLRHELIPLLEQYNPQVRQVIWRMARTLSADHEVLEDYFRLAWKECLVEQGPGFVRLSLPGFRPLGLAQKRSLIRRAISILRPNLRDIDFSAVQHAVDFIEHPASTAQRDLVSNLRLSIEGEGIFISEWNASLVDSDWPQLAPGSVFNLDVPGSVTLPNGFVLSAGAPKILPAEGFSPETDDACQAWLDADQLIFPLTVRTRQAGDRFLPLGMGGHSLKLSDFWINRQLPKRARPGWPLVCSGSQIAWIPGFLPAHTYRVTEKTARVVNLVINNCRTNKL